MSDSVRRVLYPAASAVALLLALSACGEKGVDSASSDNNSTSTATEMAGAMDGDGDGAMDITTNGLVAILDRQPDDVRARYVYRHPAETLAFFGIEPGMTVIEALPGGGWYSKILIPYLGTSGTLIGADYSTAMFPFFGFYSDERLKAKETWPEDWTAEAQGWVREGGAEIDAFQWGSLPAPLEGEVDAVLFIRALHNLARFEEKGQFLTEAIEEAHRALRPGGIVGVVQHMGPEEFSDQWASGDNGYLKPSFVIERFEAAGFEFVAESDINVNPSDQPSEDDRVWRLPPNMAGTRDDEEAARAVREIGESTRMTLKFRKPV